MVDRDVATVVDVHAGFLQPEAVGVGDRPDRQQRMAAPGDAAVVALDENLVAVPFEADGPGSLEQLDAAAEQLVLERGGNLGILLGQHLLAAHDQAHVGAHRAEHVHELDAGHARSDDDEMLRQLGRRIRLAGRQHPLAVGLAPRRDTGPAARADEDGVGVELGDPVVGLGHDLVRPFETACPAQYPHALAVEQLADVVVEPSFDEPDAAAQRLGLDGRRDLVQPHPGEPAGERHGPAGGDHRLGRDAVPQVGGAAHDLPFDQGDLGAEPGRVGRRLVARRSPADDHELHGHANEATAAPPKPLMYTNATSAGRLCTSSG